MMVVVAARGSGTVHTPAHQHARALRQEAGGARGAARRQPRRRAAVGLPSLRPRRRHARGAGEDREALDGAAAPAPGLGDGRRLRSSRVAAAARPGAAPGRGGRPASGYSWLRVRAGAVLGPEC